MRKKYTYISVILASLMLASILSGCGKSDNSMPKPEDYVELGTYKGLEYVMSSAEVSEEEIEEEMAYLAAGFAEAQVLTEGVVESGDTANIDYLGKLNGVAFDGGTAKGYDLGIGSHTFIDGFEDGLIGVKIGDTVDLNLTFPENYGSSDLAGQAVVFTVTVNSVKRDKIPEITDEFILEISDGQYKNVAEYKAALEEQMIAEQVEYQNSAIYAELLNMAVENATIKKDIPNDYIQAKISRILINAQDYATAYGIDFDTFINEYMGMTKEEYNVQAVEYANKAAKESLVMQAIANAEGISITEEELQKAIDEYVNGYGYESEEEFTSSTNMDDFKEYILTSKVEEFLYNNANIIK